MKHAFFIFSFLVVFSCKKVKQPDVVVPELSERTKLLSENRWVMTHEYTDTTMYAKSHLSEWPLSSTYDSMDLSDTCLWDSENIFLLNGEWKLKKSSKCPASVSENVGHWKLANNDSDFEIVGQGVMHIVELNKSNFRMYYESKVYYQQQLIRTDYVMWTFVAR